MIKKTFDEIIIKKIRIDSAAELTELLQSQPSDYSKYFIPFEYNFNTVKNILDKNKKDIFFGLFLNDKIIGFYMLRGFDEGFEVPSYGVWISKKFSGLGLAKLTLQHAISFCKINEIDELMLKVHPQNKVAKKIYENFCFKKAGIDDKNNNIIYKLKL